MKTPTIAVIAILGGSIAGASAASGTKTLTATEETFFESHIRPALVQYCYDCHSEETGKTRGGLLVDTKDGMVTGGDNGNVQAGATYRDSLFWQAITWGELEMPPKQKMPADVIQKFEQWLRMGAPDPRLREKVIVDSGVDIEEGRKHWSFKPPVSDPNVDIDSLVLTQLKKESLTPVGQAEPSVLLRRVNYDLIGLPPSPEEVSAFTAAWKLDSEKALENKVDELLNRSQFGERWGRHWLDVARYGESTGKDVNVTYPHAWRYRDYVYDSFNADKPYDQFITEQIAGDLLKIKTDAEWQKNLIATSFLALGTKSLNQRNPRQHLMDVVDEQIDTMSQAVLGLTVSCARCHDHKYDPIPTTDYYALAGIFMSTKTYYGTTPSAQNRRSTTLLELPIVDPMVARKRLSDSDIAQMKGQLQQLTSTRRSLRGSDGANQNQMAAIRRRISDIESKLAQVDGNGVPATVTMGVQDSPNIMNAAVLVRGNVEKPAQIVPRGFLQVLPIENAPKISTKKSGRLELAEWLTSKQNPLTARVMANRVWLYLFGEGLVSSPNNWGTTGQSPSHPKLLDHLAVQFMDGDWSVKQLIKHIVLSKTYQRSSDYSHANYEKDPENKMLWRMTPRRLDAEAIRDSILAVGGGLDLRRPYASQVSETGDNRIGRGFNQDRLVASVRYRSAYLPILRDDLPEALGLFDFADTSVSKPKREETNVPAQALYLMNDQLILLESIAMAKAITKETSDLKQQIQAAFLKAYGRLPDQADIDAAKNFFSNFKPANQVAAQTSNSRNNLSRGAQRSGRPNGMRPGGTNGGRPGGMRPGGTNGGRPGGMRPGGMAGGRQGGMGGGRGGLDIPNNSPAPIPTMSAREQSLAIFCQALLASAEFRILN